MIAETRQPTLLALGLMSGTSLDGVDAALLETDGIEAGKPGLSLTISYPPSLRQGLRAILGGVGAVPEIEHEITLFHAEVVEELRRRAGSPAIDVIGFHGHTILHQPERGRTWQIGDGALLAELTGLPVVSDFRSADVAAGGQGAPLLPAYHAALADADSRPLAVVNIGGVANVTWIGADGSLLAFDTGPGNALLDDWILQHTGAAFDQDGLLALQGVVDLAAVAQFLDHPFFVRHPPKSLDRDDFRDHVTGLVAGKTPADGAATLAALTTAAIAAAGRWFPEPPRAWLVCGGGRHNSYLMARLAEAVGNDVAPVEQQGWDGDALEAQGFAFLAVRSLSGLPLSWPGTTGVSSPQLGGRVHRPPC
jgi:anhydro-N-acetylmuramic acid kinase